MSNHNQILNNFNSISTNFDFKNPDHRVQVKINSLDFNNF